MEIAVRLRRAGPEWCVFIHGLGCCKELFDDAFRAPALDDLSLLAMDLPGHGESSRPTELAYRMEDHAGAVARILEALDAHPTHLVGHSMGGAVALLLTGLLKDPPLTRLFPLLFQLVPTAHFVLIVRDPRDAIASMITVGEKMKAAGQRHLFQDRNPLQLSEYLKGYYRPCFDSSDAAFRKRTLLVKYEDVVHHPELVMPRLSAFTGLAFEFDPASPPDTGAVDYAKVEEKHRCWHTDRFGKAVDASSVGRYQRILTSGEAEEIARECKDIMDQFGYG